MIAKTQVFLFDAERKKPFITGLSPILKPLGLGAGLAEELKLHLFKLSGSESKVSGCDLITERFTYLTDTERNLLT